MRGGKLHGSVQMVSVCVYKRLLCKKVCTEVDAYVCKVYVYVCTVCVCM